jgi:TonB family protein
MLDVLVLSRPPSWRLRYFGGGSVSAAAHSAILTLIVFATGRTAAVQQALGFDTTLVYVAPNRPAEPDRQAEQEREQAARQVVLVDAPVKGFQTIAAITDIPDELPPIDLTEQFDPRDYSGTGVEGGVADGRAMDVAPGTVVRYSPVFEASVVEEQPALLEPPVLDYPPLLRLAGIEGRAVLEFVVDPQGRVEAGTIKLIQASHPGFATAARAAAPAMRFSPARVNGRAVRVLVRVPFDFTLVRR